MQTKLKISGLTCEACERLSSKRIGRLDGVTAVTVSKDSGEALIEASRGLTAAEVNEALKDTAYRAEALS